LLRRQILRCLPGLRECRAHGNGARGLRRGGASSTGIGGGSRGDTDLSGESRLQCASFAMGLTATPPTGY